MDCSGAKRAPMVETKRNKAAIRLALSSAYADETHQNPEIESGHVREEAHIEVVGRSSNSPRRRINGSPNATVRDALFVYFCHLCRCRDMTTSRPRSFP